MFLKDMKNLYFVMEAPFAVFIMAQSLLKMITK